MIQPGMIDLDAAICGSVSNKNLHQGGLYISAWENKPPALIYLFQLFIFIFGNHVNVFFCIALISAVMLGIGIYLLVYKYTNSIFITIIYCVFAFALCFHPLFYGLGLYTEIFCTICILFALVFYEYDESSKNKFIAASLAGASFWFKEPSLPAAFCILGLLVLKNRSVKLQLKLIFFFILPSILFSILLLINGSFLAFIETIIYNFSYINVNEKVSFTHKLDFILFNFFSPIRFLLLGLVFLLYWFYKYKKFTLENLLFIVLLFSCSIFFMISPYSLGHYYLPFVAFVFVFIAKFYETYHLNNKQSSFIFIGFLLIFTYNNINETIKPQFTYKIHGYKPNRIAQKLLNEPNKTLFVDYVNAADYFIKGNKIHPTFVPVALPVHFGDSAQGVKNRKRIWHEMNNPKADFLITANNTSSYFYWHLPHNGFYENKYEKIDSLTDKDNFVLYLWQLKK